MATFSQTNIKCDDINTLLTELKKHLSIGRKLWLETRKEWFYNFQHEENASPEKNRTIILAKNHSKEWIEVEFDFGGNVYLYDEVLRRTSKALDTEILLGYYQSTSGDGRLAKFKNGQLEISFYERYFYYKPGLDDAKTIDKIILADNFGVSNSSIEALKDARLGRDSRLLDRDFIYTYYTSEGWVNDLGKAYGDWTYLHVEQKIE